MHLRHRNRAKFHRRCEHNRHTEAILINFQPDTSVVVTGFDDLPADQSHYLRSYGIIPGRTIHVLAQKPVTIIRIEQTELAIEECIARKILARLE